MAKPSAKTKMYEATIKAMQWPELKALWNKIKAGDTPDWDAGKALEYLVVRGFELGGLDVEYPFDVPPGGKPLEQIDGMVYLDSLAFLHECKDMDKVDSTPIGELERILKRRPATTFGCVFVSGAFTEPAILGADRNAPHRMLLWQHEDIEDAVANCRFKELLVEKYRVLCKFGMLDHSPSYKKLEMDA